MRKRVNGRMMNRFCDKCERWCGRSQRSHLWTKLTGKRLGNEKDEPIYCTTCLSPKDAEAIAFRLAQVVSEQPKR